MFLWYTFLFINKSLSAFSAENYSDSEKLSVKKDNSVWISVFLKINLELT